MYRLCVEIREISSKQSLSWTLANDIFSQMSKGKIVVVTDRPEVSLSATRKQWHRLIRKVKRERSSRLKSQGIDHLLTHLELMSEMTFTGKAPTDLLEADVTFATADDLIRVPPICKTIFIAHPISKERQHLLTSWMPPQALVVIYEWSE